MSNIEYIFVAEYEKSNEWTKMKASNLSRINPNVLLLLYKRTKGKVAANLEKSLAQIKDNKRIIDLSDVPEMEFNSVLLKKIEEAKSGDEVVYILNDRHLFKELGNSDFLYGSDILNAQKNIKLQNDKKNRQERNDSKQTGSTFADAVAVDMMAAIISQDDDIPSVSKKIENESKDESEDRGNPSGGKGKEESSGAKGDKKSSQSPPPEKTESILDRKCTTEEERIKRAIEFRKSLKASERAVFTIDSKSSNSERFYTEMDVQKARMVDKYFERFVENLGIYIKNKEEQNITRRHYNNFLVTLLKSYSYEDFQQSWLAVKNFNIDLSEEEYSFLKAEAQYYADMCDMLYEKDKW